MSENYTPEPKLFVPELAPSPLWSDEEPDLYDSPTSPSSIMSPSTPNTSNFDTPSPIPFKKGVLVGSGAFCKTYKTVSNNRPYAVKSRLPSTDPKSFLHEKAILTKLNQEKHPQVVTFYNTLSNENELLFDLYDANLDEVVRSYQQKTTEDDLFNFNLLRTPVIGAQQFKDWSTQLYEGLKFIHAHNIIHADLKPQNILVSNNKVYIADFSASIDIDTQPASVLAQELGSSLAISPVYADPQVRAGLCLPSFGSDWYAMGLVFAFCCTAEEPYSEAKNPAQRMLWMHKISPLDSFGIDGQQRLSTALPLIKACLTRSVEKVDEAMHSA